MVQGRNDVEARGRVSQEVCLKQPPNLPSATGEVQTFPHTHGSRGGRLTHLPQTLPTHDSPTPFPAPGWQQGFFLAFLPLERANEGDHGESLFPSSGNRLPRNRCSCRLPFLLRRGQRGGQAASPHLSPGQVHSPAGWRLSKPAAGLGEAPAPRRCAGTTPPSLLPSLPRQDLAAHRSWKVAHFLLAGGEGVPEPGSSSQAAGERKPAARLAALGKI